MWDVVVIVPPVHNPFLSGRFQYTYRYREDADKIKREIEKAGGTAIVVKHKRRIAL